MFISQWLCLLSYFFSVPRRTLGIWVLLTKPLDVPNLSTRCGLRSGSLYVTDDPGWWWWCCSVAQSCPTLQQARLPCPSSFPLVHSNSCPSNWWCHPTISSSVIPFSSCLQSFPASGSLLMSKFFTSGGQSIAVSASGSILPMNIQVDFL